MAFVNELISDEGIKKYNLEEFEWNLFRHLRDTKGFPLSHLKSRDAQWTIDDDRNIWLRHIERQYIEGRNKHLWVFSWQENLLLFEFDQSCGGEPPSETTGLSPFIWHRYELARVRLPFWLKPTEQTQPANPLSKPNIQLPDNLRSCLPEIFHDLKEALTAYKDYGIHSESVKHQATFDF